MQAIERFSEHIVTDPKAGGADMSISEKFDEVLAIKYGYGIGGSDGAAAMQDILKFLSTEQKANMVDVLVGDLVDDINEVRKTF